MNNSQRTGRGVRRGLTGAGIACALAAAGVAQAQPAPANTVPQPLPTIPFGAVQPAPLQPNGPQPTPVQPAMPQPSATQGAALPPSGPALSAQPTGLTAKPDALAQELAKQPGGLSLDEVARIALKTRPSLRAKEADLRAAAAKVDQAFVGFFPRVGVSFQYTRLSPVANPFASLVNSPLFAGAETGQKPIEYPLCPDSPTQDRKSEKATFCGFYDNYSFTASLLVPISDYLLRITQNYGAASHAEKSKRHELEADTLTAAADAKVAYLSWIRAKGQFFVAKDAVATTKAHVEDVKRLKLVGFSSQADVLRAESQLAAAEQAAVSVEAFASIAEEQVRIAIGLPKEKPLTVGIDVFNISAPAALPALATVQDQALDKREEIRALDETELSLKDVESVTRASYYPRVDAFADLQVANPNQRYTFSGQEWNTTWDAGVRVSWTFNDTFTTIGAAAESKARVSQIAEQKKVVKDGLRLEVAAAWAEIKKSGATIDAATRGLTAAAESLRVRRELFLQGKATNVEMLDAEAEVTRAKLSKLDAQIGLIVAQIRYDHAIGNDVGTQKAAVGPARTGDDDDASAKKVTNVASAAPAIAAPGPMLPLAK